MNPYPLAFQVGPLGLTGVNKGDHMNNINLLSGDRRVIRQLIDCARTDIASARLSRTVGRRATAAVYLKRAASDRRIAADIMRGAL